MMNMVFFCLTAMPIQDVTNHGSLKTPFSLSANCHNILGKIVKWFSWLCWSTFLLIELLSAKASGCSPPYYFTHSLREKRWIHAFHNLTGISIWLADSPIHTDNCFTKQASSINQIVKLIITVIPHLKNPNKYFFHFYFNQMLVNILSYTMTNN